MAENIYEEKVSSALHLAIPSIPNDESVNHMC